MSSDPQARLINPAIKKFCFVHTGRTSRNNNGGNGRIGNYYYRDLDKKTTKKPPQTQSWQTVYTKRLKIAETQVYPENCLIEVK